MMQKKMSSHILDMVKKKNEEILSKLKEEKDESKQLDLYDQYIANQLKERYKPTQIIMKDR